MNAHTPWKKALKLSVKVLSTKVLIEDTIFTSKLEYRPLKILSLLIC